MKKFILIFVCCLLLVCFNKLNAQSGGPPMLTDDPGIVDVGKWEINSALSFSISNPSIVKFPYLDISYGIANNLQLKAESGYLISANNQLVSTKMDGISLGLKFHFLSEEKYFVSMGIYPQATISGDEQQILIPLLMEKTMGKFLIGEDIGLVIGRDNFMSFQNGFLLGYTIHKGVEIMSEYFVEKNLKKKQWSGFLNLGARYALNTTFSIIGSFGTQLQTPNNEPREKLIGYVALQTHL